MELEKEEDAKTKELVRKLQKFISIDDLWSLFNTLLGAAENVARHVLSTEKRNHRNLSNQTKYGLLHLHSILTLFQKILRDEINYEEFKIGGHFPKDDDAWQSEDDFEKRLILLVKLYYKHFETEGKI